MNYDTQGIQSKGRSSDLRSQEESSAGELEKSAGFIKGEKKQYEGNKLYPGAKIGRLILLEKVGKKWKCLCDCENTCHPLSCNLASGGTKSCGCLRRDMEPHNKTHGLSHKSSEYKVWKNMIGRCHNPNCTYYYNYGGRGILVCERWRNSFTDFLSDMGPKPSPGHSIERIDANGNYEPSNCCWATRLEQARNTRTNHFIEVNGERLTIQEWSRKTGIHQSTIVRRVQAGLSPEECIRTQRYYRKRMENPPRWPD